MHWDRQGVILPAYKGNWNVRLDEVRRHRAREKSMASIGCISSEPLPTRTTRWDWRHSTDLIHWTEATKTPVLPRRPGHFDSRVVEPGPPPILTPHGIVLIYNGADDNLVYRTAVAMFDRNDPRKVLYRSKYPIFGPENRGRRLARCPTSYLWKAWRAGEITTSSITAARTSMWASPRPTLSNKRYSPFGGGTRKHRDDAFPSICALILPVVPRDPSCSDAKRFPFSRSFSR